MIATMFFAYRLTYRKGRIVMEAKDDQGVENWLRMQRSKFISGYDLYRWKKFMRAYAVALNLAGILLIAAAVFFCPWYLFAVIPLELFFFAMTFQTKRNASNASAVPSVRKGLFSKKAPEKWILSKLKVWYASYEPKINDFLERYGFVTAAFLCVLASIICSSFFLFVAAIAMFVFYGIIMKRQGRTEKEITNAILMGIVSIIYALLAIGVIAFLCVVIYTVGKHSFAAAAVLTVAVAAAILGVFHLWKACQRDPKLAKTVQTLAIVFLVFSFLNSMINKHKKP